MTLETNSSFEKVSFDKEAKDWMFIFADSISIFVSGFWRLLENSKIILVSLDQGHQFGLPKPLNLVEEVTAILSGKKLIELKVDENTADLTLVLTNGIEIQILIASASYETYQFSIADKNFIGMGSGHIAIFWQKTKSLEICDDLIVIVKIETISQFGIDAKPDRVFKTK